MNKNFFGEFDRSTLLKLEIFRRYAREWLPVFLTKWRKRKSIGNVLIYDFFAGPGTDRKGNPGSPLIVIDEVKKFLEEREQVADEKLPVTFFFYDKDKEKIENLQNEINKIYLPEHYQVYCSAKPFHEAFYENMQYLEDDYAAKLLIMDQFGVKEISDNIFLSLIDLPYADFLFFIASSSINRFCNQQEFKKIFHEGREEVNSYGYNLIHRFVYDHYKKLIPYSKAYYLAPFSIKKEKNILGIIFGSSNILGLEKFLEVAWKLDSTNGEANYNIGNDPFFGGQLDLFEPERNVIKKQGEFKNDLIAFLKKEYQDNTTLYRFTLEKGFLPKHTNDILRELQRKGLIEVNNVMDGSKARKGSFYINLDNFNTNDVKVQFKYTKRDD